MNRKKARATVPHILSLITAIMIGLAVIVSCAIACGDTHTSPASQTPGGQHHG